MKIDIDIIDDAILDAFEAISLGQHPEQFIQESWDFDMEVVTREMFPSYYQVFTIWALAVRSVYSNYWNPNS